MSIRRSQLVNRFQLALFSSTNPIPFALDFPQVLKARAVTPVRTKRLPSSAIPSEKELLEPPSLFEGRLDPRIVHKTFTVSSSDPFDRHLPVVLDRAESSTSRTTCW